MWLACLAIAVYHISVLQAVQKNQCAKFNKRTGNMMFSYIFNEPQMTLLFILSTIYGREMYSSMKKPHNGMNYINSELKFCLIP